MTERAVISGVYADLKTVKTRSVCQVIIEVPIEHGKAIVDAFGFPQPGSEVNVAIARINTSRKPEPKKEPRPFGELPYPQQAALACQSEPFQAYLGVDNEEDAATAVRKYCGVNSRAALSPHTSSGQKWTELYGQYQRTTPF